MPAPAKSRMGLSFLTGMIGAYVFAVIFVKIGRTVGLDTVFSATNADYIMNVLAGFFTGFLTMYITRINRLRILVYVFGSLIVMDSIAYFSTPMPIADMIDRMLTDMAFLVAGFVSYKLLPSANTEDN